LVDVIGRLRDGAVGALLLTLAACGGGGGSGQAPAGQPAAAAPTPAPADPYQVSWTGYMSRTYDGELGECVDAAKAALAKLELQLTSDESGGIFRQKMEAQSQDGTALVVDVQEVTKTQTRVSVKVGYLLGDRDAERRVHSEIEGELAAKRKETEERRHRWQGLSGGGDVRK
jgi:hypothetical protein